MFSCFFSPISVTVLLTLDTFFSCFCYWNSWHCPCVFLINFWLIFPMSLLFTLKKLFSCLMILKSLFWHILLLLKELVYSLYYWIWGYRSLVFILHLKTFLLDGFCCWLWLVDYFCKVFIFGFECIILVSFLLTWKSLPYGLNCCFWKYYSNAIIIDFEGIVLPSSFLTLEASLSCNS